MRKRGPPLISFATVRFMDDQSLDAVARAIHERWRVQQRAGGVAAPPTWAELDESRRNSSRAQARDIDAKLRLVGCAIAPLTDDAATHFKFTEAEVESLGSHEHDRWVKERVADGWTSGPKDAARKMTPYLVPFSELPPDIAEYDRLFVRELPNLLAAAYLQVVRVTPS